MAHTKGRSSRCAFQPRPKKKAPVPGPARVAKDPLPAEQRAHYQLLLRMFASTFAAELAAEDLHSAIQDVKKALYERDFAAAFMNPEGLPSYAARWSPTRAACYAGVLAELETRALTGAGEDGHEDGRTTGDENADEGGNADATTESDSAVVVQRSATPLEIVALGGGAAELAAVGSLLAQDPSFAASLTILDSGPWGSVLERLQTGLTTPPALSKYASASAHAANHALLEEPERLNVRFEQADVLELAAQVAAARSTADGAGPGEAGSAEAEAAQAAAAVPDALHAAVYGSATAVPRPVLVTLLFALNEMYAASRGKTTVLLLALTRLLPVGSLLLVVDSPGSYSEATVGREMRRYPMKMLLEHTLLREERGVRKEKAWELVESQDSVWFRMPDGLEYPIPLENMRYQKHVYKLVKPESRTNKKSD
ncbi:hypothetical protein BROUX41_003769 [Berkeleyomyces rouxiae]|uniref:uncharacterized protein n=1 Tax=Berkeleyomyces rouxiae TaxID=2035830 RepID=UPI003B765ACF